MGPESIEQFAWIARARAMELEIKMRPLGGRSKMLKAAWPGICKALGFEKAPKMTIKALAQVAEICKLKAGM